MLRAESMVRSRSIFLVYKIIYGDAVLLPVPMLLLESSLSL